MSAAEIVEHYVFALDTEVVEHIDDGFGHRSGAAHIVFDVLGGGMVLEVGVVHHVVDEAGCVGYAGFVGCGVGTVESQMEVEVGEVLLELMEVVEVEDFVEGAGTVEVVHLSVGAVERAREVHNLCTKRSHTGATANPNHLGVLRSVAPLTVFGTADVEVAVGAGHYDFVAGLEREYVARCNTGIDIDEGASAAFGSALSAFGAVDWRRGDTDGEHKDVALGRIVGHRVGAHGGFGVDAVEVEHLVLFPSGQIFVTDKAAVEVAVADVECGYLDLCVAAGDEVHMFAWRQLDLEFLDECSYVAVGDDGAFVLFDAENAGRYGDAEVFFYLALASEAPALLNLFAGEESDLGGQDAYAAFEDLATALSARAFAATGGGEVDALLGEGGDERVACRYGEFFVVVDGNGDVALRYELGAQQKQQYNQYEYDGQEDDQ